MIRYAALLLLVAATASAQITAVANPPNVCSDDGHLPYLNFDFIVHNAGDKDMKVKEVRAFVLDRAGRVIERRAIAQAALEIILPNKIASAGSDALVFNPFMFTSNAAMDRVRFELDYADESATQTATVVVMPRSCVTRTRLVLPLAGRVMVGDGYDFLSHHRRTYYIGPGAKKAGMTDNVGRFGLDLMIVDEQGSHFKGEPSKNENSLTWGQPVRAPGDGIVASIFNDQPDNTVIGSENLWVNRSLAENEMTSSGNYVLIDHGGGEFSLVAHLHRGSVRVKPGDHVSARQVIAEAGDSGSSLEPHVHYELRTGWGVKGIHSLPPYFHDVMVVGTGERAGAKGIPVNTGDVLIAK